MAFRLRREYARYVRVALNSNDELKYHIIVARDLPVMSPARAAYLIKRANEVGKMLKSLHDYLDKKRQEEEKKKKKKKDP